MTVHQESLPLELWVVDPGGLVHAWPLIMLYRTACNRPCGRWPLWTGQTKRCPVCFPGPA